MISALPLTGNTEFEVTDAMSLGLFPRRKSAAISSSHDVDLTTPPRHHQKCTTRFDDATSINLEMPTDACATHHQVQKRPVPTDLFGSRPELDKIHQPSSKVISSLPPHSKHHRTQLSSMRWRPPAPQPPRCRCRRSRRSRWVCCILISRFDSLFKMLSLVFTADLRVAEHAERLFEWEFKTPADLYISITLLADAEMQAGEA